MHPINNTSFFKSFILKSSLLTIFIGFFSFYIFITLIFSGSYMYLADGSSTGTLDILKFSIFTSFNFDIDDLSLKSNVYYFLILFLHQIFALIITIVFTSAVVLKFFYLPKFFEFKNKCNYLEESDELIVTLYNSININVTNCHIRVYGREESFDINNTKSLININNNNPIFEKIYPFMEMHLATRLRIKLDKGDVLYKWMKENKIEDKKLDIIILVEANVSKIDSAVYEIHKYSIDSKDIKKTVDFYGPKSIDLDYDDFSKSKGWSEFDE